MIDCRALDKGEIQALFDDANEFFNSKTGRYYKTGDVEYGRARHYGVWINDFTRDGLNNLLSGYIIDEDDERYVDWDGLAWNDALCEGASFEPSNCSLYHKAMDDIWKHRENFDGDVYAYAGLEGIDG